MKTEVLFLNPTFLWPYLGLRDSSDFCGLSLEPEAVGPLFNYTAVFHARRDDGVWVLRFSSLYQDESDGVSLLNDFLCFLK